MTLIQTIGAVLSSAAACAATDVISKTFRIGAQAIISKLQRFVSDAPASIEELNDLKNNTKLIESLGRLSQDELQEIVQDIKELKEAAPPNVFTPEVVVILTQYKGKNVTVDNIEGRFDGKFERAEIDNLTISNVHGAAPSRPLKKT